MDPTNSNSPENDAKAAPSNRTPDNRPGSSGLNSSREAPTDTARTPMERIKSHPVSTALTLTAIILGSAASITSYAGYHLYRSSDVTTNAEIARSYVALSTHQKEVAGLKQDIARLDASLKTLTSENLDQANKLREALNKLARQDTSTARVVRFCEELRDDLLAQEYAQEQVEKAIRNGGSSTMAYQEKVTPQRQAEMQREVLDLRRRSDQLQQRISQIRSTLQTCSAYPPQD
ncbi:hypothetical protein [Stenotrophomonas maltophilia]|uniref:hypothetical protein n=1 Tax=Stenotrophomonas maltophilia TaxID=40324 RepID=UPI000A6D642F|nr:hypothetical protein [Stenotrophomonas maltophilia]